jgi:hypothetical protein
MKFRSVVGHFILFNKAELSILPPPTTLKHNSHHGKSILLRFQTYRANRAGIQSKEAKRILVTGAAGQIGYVLVTAVARGDLLGPDQPVILHMLDIAPMQNQLDGTVMELEDCAFPLLKGMAINYPILIQETVRSKNFPFCNSLCAMSVLASGIIQNTNTSSFCSQKFVLWFGSWSEFLSGRCCGHY